VRWFWTILVLVLSAGCGQRIIIYSPPPPSYPPVLSVDLKVTDLGEKIDWSDSLTTEPGHLLRFRVEIENSGSGMAHRVEIKISLADPFSYQKGSTTIGSNSAPDGICEEGLGINFLAPNSTKIIEFGVEISELTTEDDYEVKVAVDAVNHPQLTDILKIHVASMVLKF